MSVRRDQSCPSSAEDDEVGGLIDSTGRNWMWRWGCEAPECGPELKKAKSFLVPCAAAGSVPPSCNCASSFSPSFSHAFRHAYAAAKSFFSRRSVCRLYFSVARMKWEGMTGYLLRTRTWLWFWGSTPAGSGVIRRAGEGSRKGFGFLDLGCDGDLEVSLLVLGEGFLARAGQ